MSAPTFRPFPGGGHVRPEAVLSQDRFFGFRRVLRTAGESQRHDERFLQFPERDRAVRHREVFIEIPSVSFEEIGGLGEIKEQIVRSIVWPEQHGNFSKLSDAERLRESLLRRSRTGKTLAAKAIASLSNANFISVKGPELLSKWVGESEKRSGRFLKKPGRRRPALYFSTKLIPWSP
jgi:transitional endoplasmic reticulum ATPase